MHSRAGPPDTQFSEFLHWQHDSHRSILLADGSCSSPRSGQATWHTVEDILVSGNECPAVFGCYTVSAPLKVVSLEAFQGNSKSAPLIASWGDSREKDGA